MKLFHWLNMPLILITLFGLQFFMNEISIHVDKLLPPPSWFMELFNKIFDSDFGIWGGIFRVVILAPIVEELIFRGIIFSGFQRNYHAFWAIFFSALLFALFHLNPWQLGPTFLLGLILGWVRLQTGSLLAAIFTHALHNGMVFLTVYLKTDLAAYLLPDNKVISYEICITILVYGALFIYYINNKRKKIAL
jgi:membrane protease YdiL (CAAX protease family)